MAKVWAIVPAAGIGSRMAADRPKQYLQIGDRTIIQLTLERLCACDEIDSVVLGLCVDDAWWPPLKFSHPKLVAIVKGGKERAHTVLNGLKYITDNGGAQDGVLVHDAVRPCVRIADIQRLLQINDENGAILALPINDTVKRASQSGTIGETVSRDHLWRAMTPQYFPVRALQHSLNESIKQGHLATDESAAMERSGFQPKLVACAADNLKITHPDDLPLAKTILDAQSSQIGESR